MPATRVYVSQCLVQTFEAVAKLSMLQPCWLLAIELFQARRDAAVASSKFLMDHSSHELRDAPTNSQQLFDNKVKEIAKSNFETQQQIFGFFH